MVSIESLKAKRLSAKPGAPQTGYDAIYTKADGLYTEAPDGTEVKIGPRADKRTATANIGDGVGVITTGIKGGFECPITGHITAARIESLDGTSGSIAIAVWIEAFADGVPQDADEVDIFSISSGIQSQETGLSIPVVAGDWISFNVDSVTSMKLVAISLTIEG